MKKTYTNPLAQIILLQPVDLITASFPFPSASEGEGEIVDWIE